MNDIPESASLSSCQTAPDDGSGKPLRIVGIGAGAGGLEAVQLLFGAMPVDAGLAFVICRFVEPGLADPLAELLRAQTSMPIVRAEDGMVLEANRIHLVKPAAKMVLLKDRLTRFDDGEADEVSPIDLLFHSIAASAGPSAIAIVLSGNGEDGRRGAETVRRAGGLVLAQHPESTDYGAMPRHLIDADLASVVAVPGAMPDIIQAHIAEERGRTERQDRRESDDAAFSRIIAALRTSFGMDGQAYRPSLVQKRVRSRLERSHMASVSAYADLLENDPTERLRLHDDILISVTAFFRDPEAFATLESKVAPTLIERMAEERPIRVWVPGCATGEEAYSIAMVLLSRIDQQRRSPHLEVIASDRHARALNLAKHGRYRRDRLGSAPSSLVERYMEDKGDHLEVGPLLRRHVTFVEHDLLQAAPPDDIDLVSCRNLIIYLAARFREKALLACVDALRKPGFLLLGSSEQPGQLLEGLTVIDARWRIYRKGAVQEGGGALKKLVASKVRHPGETIVRATRARSSPDALAARRSAEGSSDLDGVFSQNQRMLESTIDTLLASNDTLRRRNRDLRVENQRLVAAHAALDDVATMIAHDLRAPLRAAEQVFIELKGKTVAALGQEDAVRCLRPMQIQLFGLDRLIDDLLAYARQGRPERSDLETVDMGALLKETLAIVGLPNGIKVMIQPPTLQIVTWRAPLACILRNLLVRAIGGMGEGGGSIRIDMASSGQVLDVTLADDGIKGSDGARDLGLAIVRQLLDGAGGRLTLNDGHSTRGREARVAWPIAASVLPPCEAAATAAPETRGDDPAVT